MRLLRLILLYSALLGILGFLVLTYKKQSRITSLNSPIPSALTIFSNNQVSTLDLWKPIIDSVFQAIKGEPEITAVSGLMYEVNDSKTLYSKNSNKKVPMASLTKIMTAIIALENPEKPKLYKVLDKDLVGEDSMGLSSGEEFSLEGLLYGLMLHSGNDAAEALSNYYPGGRAGFIKAMNDKAKALGALDTNFTNPTGLQGDGDQYTTAHDLLIITKYALQNPVFAKIVSTYEYHIPKSNYHKAYDLYNETNLLTSYPGVKGVKTGFTDEAGFCLITYLDYEGKQVIGILLGSSNRRQEMKDLLDYSLESLGIKPPPHT